MNTFFRLCASLTIFCSATIFAKQEIKQAFNARISPNGEFVVFRWDSDLWSCRIKDGNAIALTKSPALETNPCFSKDGKHVYFLSNRDDTFQIYKCDLETLNTTKITSHSEGFYALRQEFPDGKHLLVYAYRDGNGFESGRFYKVNIENGKEEMLFNDYGNGGNLSSDGKKLIFRREGIEHFRKRYEGSKSSQIWIYDLETKQFECIFNLPYETREPIWAPDNKSFFYVNFISGVGNLHSYNLETKTDTPLTNFTDGIVTTLSISADGKNLIFNQLADTYHMNLQETPATYKKIPISGILIDLPKQTQRNIYSKLDNLDSPGTFEFTKNASQVAFTTAGDLFVMETVLRQPIAITSTTEFHDREAIFGPNDEDIYFLRDNGVSINLYKASRSNPEQAWWENISFNIEPITNDKQTRHNLSLSPKGDKLIWIQDRGSVIISDIDGKNQKEIFGSTYGGIHYSWSPDGRWIVLASSDSNENWDVWIVSTTNERKPYNLSRHPNLDFHPKWSPDGKKIAFIGRRYDNTVGIYYVYLNRLDDRPKDYAKQLEEARVKYYKKNGTPPPNNNAEKAPCQNSENDKVIIDFDDLENRIKLIPIQGNNPNNLFWSSNGKSLAFSATNENKYATWFLNFPVDNQRPSLLNNEVGSGATWLADGRILWALDSIPAISNNRLPFNIYKERNVLEHKRLAFKTIWRQLRDNFYDPTMKGVDWEKTLSRYESLVDNARDNTALQQLINMLLGELNASHLYFQMKSNAPSTSTNQWTAITYHLGLFFDESYQGKGLKVKQVIRNGPTDTSPNLVKEGDIILSVDNIDVDEQSDLTNIMTKPFQQHFKVVVKKSDETLQTMYIPATTFGQIRQLRQKETLYNNSQMVDKLSNKKIGYLNISQMNMPSLRQFEHDVFATTFDRDALIIDVRNNPGGFISDYLLSILCHPQHAATLPRKGEISYPSTYTGKVTYNKPLVVLCNQNTCSNAEIFSHAIKTLKRGKIIGIPSQAAVISTPRCKILDIGTLSIPDRGWWPTSHGIDMELKGVIPNIIIWPQPEEIPSGKDRHIEEAIKVLLEEIENEKKIAPKLIWANEGYDAIPTNKK